MKLVKKRKINQDGIKYIDLTIPKNHNYILSNNIIVHNCGTGCGFSVENKYISKLPEVSEEMHPTETVISVRDSKTGWAVALKELISLLYSGIIPEWDVSKVRPAGAPLKTFGGRASGPQPLVELFKFTVKLFKKAAGRKLTSLECHDLMCKVAEIVVCGGTRRSALISMSDLSDPLMRNAKFGQWWIENPQRSLSNNSACYTSKPPIGQFMEEWLHLYKSKSGERGIINLHGIKKKLKLIGKRDTDLVAGVNPCVEIYLRDKQFCNLSEVVIRPEDTLETLKRKVKIASILGTIQATLTDFRYIGKKWERNCKEEALIGVSLTGIMDHELMSGRITNRGEKVFDHNGTTYRLNAALYELKNIVIETNKIWAEKLGINIAGATTCVKPSGCATLDTEIKTTFGDLTFAELAYKIGIDNIQFEPGLWIDIDSNIKVFDDNNEEQNIEKFYINGIQEVYEIEDEFGNKYSFTGNHELKLANGTWKRVDELSSGDNIKSF